VLERTGGGWGWADPGPTGGQVRKVVGSPWCHPDFGRQTRSEGDPGGPEPVWAVPFF
jgi:hypothetical protein